jgi:hypothetical protein
LIFITERPLGQATMEQERGVVARVLRRYIRSQGFRIGEVELALPWDGQEASALAAAKQTTAKTVLVGWAETQQTYRAAPGMPMQAVRATVQVRALTADTGGQLALERAEVTVFHADAAQAAEQALEKAAYEVASRLVSALPGPRLERGERPSVVSDGQ